MPLLVGEDQAVKVVPRKVGGVSHRGERTDCELTGLGSEEQEAEEQELQGGDGCCAY